MALDSPFTENVANNIKEQFHKKTDDFTAGASSVEFKDVLYTGDFKKIKSFLRSTHWPPQHKERSSLWWQICQLKYKVSSSLYGDLVTELFGAEGTLQVSLPGFIDLSAMHQHHLNEQGVKVTKKMMCVLGRSRPDVTFAPTLYTMACLLLHYLQEEQVFDTLDSMLRSQTRPILQTRISYEASAYVLKDLLKKYNKKLYVHMIQQHMKPEQVLSGWIWWLFRDLPFAYLVRVFDCYLFEGPKVLYRVTLAILRFYFDSQVKTGLPNTEIDLNMAISQFSKEMPNISVASLLKASFKIRGFSRKEIQKLVVKEEMYVKSLSNTQGLQPTFTRSPSSESLNKDKVTVSRSFSLQEIGSSLLSVKEDTDETFTKSKSLSQGTVFVPFSKVKSTLLNLMLWEKLWQWLPDRVRILVPELLFSTSEHGTSLRTFYSMVSERPENCPGTILLIKTTSQKLIGAYCSSDWIEREKNKKKMIYFGTGETFVFSLLPECAHYPWVGLTLRENTPSRAQYFQAGDLNTIHIGGGGGGVAITLDEDLLNGESQSCDTFNNPPLAGKPDFMCAAVEVFGFS